MIFSKEYVIFISCLEKILLIFGLNSFKLRNISACFFTFTYLVVKKFNVKSPFVERVIGAASRRKY